MCLFHKYVLINEKRVRVTWFGEYAIPVTLNNNIVTVYKCSKCSKYKGYVCSSPLGLFKQRLTDKEIPLCLNADEIDYQI